MKTHFKFLFSAALVYAMTCFVLIGCGGENAFDAASSGELSGYIVVSSITTDPATGPGMVTMFKPDGSFYKVIRDFFQSTTDWAAGITFQAPRNVILAVEGSASDRIERVPVDDPSMYQTVASGFIGGAPLRSLAANSNGDIYVIENNAATSTIEKLNSNFARSGGPWIGTTTGSCSLNNNGPWGATYDPHTGRLFQTSTSGRLNIYSDTDGTCFASIATAPFISANGPSGIVYHEATNKILVVLATVHQIQACDTNGTNCAVIYASASVLSTPRAIAVDSDGYIYVSSIGNDSIVKLSWSGTGTATLVSAPLIAASVYTQNVQSILVIP